MRVIRTVLSVTMLLLLAAAPARADATVFLGSATPPVNRTTKGLAVSVDLLILGFEFEWAEVSESLSNAAPGLRTGMGNLMLQTPVPLAGIQFYLTTGGGIYRERLGDRHETHLAANAGGGAKISLVGPLQARFDYRVFKLRGTPLHSVARRIYAGMNLSF